MRGFRPYTGVHIYRQAHWALLGCLFALLLFGCGKEATPTSAANVAPRVEATAQVTMTATLELEGKVTDDMLPMGRLTTEWAMVSGPGPVTFGDQSEVKTTATFTQPGTYVLRLTASDGQRGP